ncbi:hypothetical protein GGR56DRAFT_265062 [Xylariaceae sp. FL0804]|nr:hypothetical protein GGR56DRAFT_265062 [Xylariaceae sp. FL0804]
MDDTPQPAESAAPSPPTRGRPAGVRKHGGRGFQKKTARKTAPVKRGVGRPPRRGRNKTYLDARVQAAYERKRELADVYSIVGNSLKSALESVADAEMKDMVDNPTAYQATPGYLELEGQLDDLYQQKVRAADLELKTRTAIAKREFELHTDWENQKFTAGINAATADFFDASLNRCGILDELRREGCPLTIPDSAYTYVEAQSDDILQQQGPRVVYRSDGVEVPCPSRTDDNRKILTKAQVKKAKLLSKRKAEDPAEGQPVSKKSALLSGLARLETGEDKPTARPRHIKSLLSAEIETDGEPESNVPSNAPSPTPANEAQSPSSEPKVEASRKKDVPELPSGTSEPDAWGVRTVNRRGPRANNRLIIPSVFEWDNDEIGFRDSTNDSTRKATRGTRGKFLNKPNSRNHHLDRTIVTYDCLDYEEGDLDPELVAKHRLHPKYGFFLPDSVNESEPPGERVEVLQPIVVLTPNGNILHASRSARGIKMDRALETDAKKERMTRTLTQYCDNADIAQDEITTDEMRERDRRTLEQLATTEGGGEGEGVGEHSQEEDVQAQAEAANEQAARDNTNQLLNAAAHLEEETQLLASSNQRSSRPYDAVRDVFTDAEPSLPPSAEVAAPTEVDTTALSSLADAAEHVSQAPPYRQEYRNEPPLDPRLAYPLDQRNEPPLDPRPAYPLDQRFERMDAAAPGDCMIDPRLLGTAPHQPPPPPPPPPNAFLQTALNPTPAFTHIAPAPSHGFDVPPQPPPVSRNPFTNQNSSRSSPVLPPLRPTRRDKGLDVHQPPPPVSEYSSPHMLPQRISGPYYPPPPSRPYHYSIHEPTPIAPIPLQQGHMMGGPSLMPQSQVPRPAPLAMVPYQLLSPPRQSQAQMTGMPPTYLAPAPSVSPPAPSMVLSPTSRSRGSFSAGGNASNNNKYRKIAAAPIPHNRPWQGGGGSELRLTHYEYKDAIKDYQATEAPPHSGPTTIRGWSINNVSKSRSKGLSSRKGDAEEKDSPK